MKYNEMLTINKNEMSAILEQKEDNDAEWEVKLKIAVDEAVLKESESS